MGQRYAPLYTRDDGPLYRQPRSERYRRSVTIPDNVSPPVRLLFAQMRILGVTYDDLEEASGTRRATMKQWRRKNKPNLETLEAAYNAMGMFLIPAPLLEIQPPKIAALMGELAAQMKVSMPEAFAALLDWTARQQNQAIASDQRLAEIARRRAANDNTPRKRPRKGKVVAT